MTRVGEAVAHSNIALVKYWGKREDAAGELNLPAVGSISMTLSAMETRTTVRFDSELRQDVFLLDGQKVGWERVTTFLDLIRQRAGITTHAIAYSTNNFPTGAGLASSASGFAALALAATRAAGMEPDRSELSRLARCGSGSAARSVFGGFVELDRGERQDGLDCVARSIAGPDHWPLRVVVAITTEGPKTTGSTAGMRRTARTSPYFSAFVENQAADLAEARSAVAERDFDRLAAVTESNCLKMHAAMMTADPPLLYWLPASLAVLDEVRHLRAGGVPVCFTMDAGPQVKAICEPDSAGVVAEALAQVDGVSRVFVSDLGEGVR